jgi:hypothetical protein
MISKYILRKHKKEVLAMYGGDDEAELSYIIVVTTAGMLKKCILFTLQQNPLLSKRFCPWPSS